MTAMPQAKKTACAMCTPYGPRLNRLRDRPAAGEGRAEHFGADQDRRADHGRRRSATGCGGCRTGCRAAHDISMAADASPKPAARIKCRRTVFRSAAAAARRRPGHGRHEVRWRAATLSAIARKAGARSVTPRRGSALASSSPASTSAARMRSISARAELDQRRAHHGARQPAEQHQRLLHAVVHVDPGLGVEHPRGRLDAVVERLRRGEVVRLHRAEQLRLQVGDHAAGAGQQAVAAEHQRARTARRCGW